MFCPECGSENPEHNKFCGKCGTEIHSPAPKLIKKDYLVGFLWLFIIFLVFAAVGCLVIDYSKYVGVITYCLQILGLSLIFIVVFVKIAKNLKK
jgi:predicted nucleic acid-binding Zn ribbon protein